jgi:hypothetical protein
MAWKKEFPTRCNIPHEQRLQKMQSKAINASLSKCGFSCKTARAIVFGSPWFGGLGWCHLFFEQGMQRMMLTMIKHPHTLGPFQSLLQINLHWYQVVSVVSFSPLQSPHIPLPYLDHAWLDSTRQFLTHCSATMEIPEISLPKMLRQHATCIMDKFITLVLPKPTLQKLNACRLWLCITLVSNIIPLAGITIDQGAWLGQHPMPSSTADCPVQMRPHATIWGMWRKTLSDSLCSNTRQYVITSRPGTLTTGLEVWTPESKPQPSQ